MSKLRIATWNLDHASNSTRPVDLQIAKLRVFNADIAVLTETCDAVDLSRYGYEPALTDKNDYGKYCSVIWSKFPFLKSYATYDPATAVCRQVETPLGPLIFYATIITYRDDTGEDGTKKRWEEHVSEIAKQGDDWKAIQGQAGPNVPFCVAGDFNQTRDGSNRYSTKETIEQLDSQLHANKLVCLTEEDFEASEKLLPDPAKGYARSNVDHICISQSFSAKHEIGAWDHFNASGKYLSDHNGVYVDFF